MYIYVYKFYVGTSIDSNSTNSSTSIIYTAVGTVGGTVLFLSILLCIIILCFRIYHKKKLRIFDSRENDIIKTELNLDVNMSINPSYDTIKYTRRQDDQYNCAITLNNKQDTMIVDFTGDPSFGGDNVAVVTIQSNPLWTSNSKINKIVSDHEDEDENGYVEPNSLDISAAEYLKVIAFGPVTKDDHVKSIYEKIN